MTKIGANPEAIENMIHIISRFIDLQENVVEGLKNEYQGVGSEWDDRKYEELGEVINEATIAIKGNYNTLSTCVTKLQLLKSIMEDYLAQHIR